MKSTLQIASLSAATALVLSTAASAGYTVTQTTAAAPTYGTTLNFDEVGTPTGLVSGDTWLASHGINITDGVNGNNTVVDDFTDDLPWVGTGNSNFGFWGVNLNFAQGVSELSFQCWDTGGSPSPFGGGLNIAIVDENFNFLGGGTFTGAWGGVGKTWINITTSGGSLIHHVVAFNNSFDPYTYVDNLSWNTVPGPGSLALLGFAMLGGRRRKN